MTSVLLTLIAPSALEEQLSGVLFAHEPTACAGFSVRDVRYHGNAIVYFDVAEQIRGYVRMIEITIALQENEVGSLLQIIAAELPNSGISYRTSQSSFPKRIETVNLVSPRVRLFRFERAEPMSVSIAQVICRERRRMALGIDL